MCYSFLITLCAEAMLPQPIQPKAQVLLLDENFRACHSSLSTSGKKMLVGGGGKAGEWKILDLANGHSLIDGAKSPHRCGPVWGTAVSSDESLLAIGGNGGRLFVIDAKTGDLVWNISKNIEFGVVHDVCFTPDNKFLVSQITDMSIRVWDIRNQKWHALFGFNPVRVRDNLWAGYGENERPKRFYVIPGEYDLGMTFALSPDGKTMAVAGNLDGVVPLVNLETGKVVKTLRLKQPSSHALAYSADGKWLLVSGPAMGKSLRKGQVFDKEPEIEIWNVDRNLMVTSLGRHDFAIGNMAISPDKKTIVSGGLGDGVRVWDVPTGKLKFRYFGKGSPCFPKVRFFSDGSKLVENDVSCAGCGFLPDGKTFYIVPAWRLETELHFYDTATGRPVDYRARVKALPHPKVDIRK